jgi:NADH-quinone oxidoreductase subunit L
MLDLVWPGLFLPLVGFFILAGSSSVIGRRAANVIACTTIFLSFLCFVALTYGMHELTHVNTSLYSWIPIKGIQADFEVHIDSLSLLMTLIITGIGFLIHVYSVGYMDHEEDFARYFAFLNFFIFSMLLLVLAGNLLLLFVGWEGVGLASYFLIGFWYYRTAAAKAATKAFIVNRIGDFGFLVALLLTFYLFGTSNILEVSHLAKQQFPTGGPILMLLTLLYFWAAAAKSAQIPLQVWLPDAMEGPTPVSALIHAATMVTAGVYLVVRMHPIFLLTPESLHFIGYVGAITALYASVCALGQTDLKRVLAYSTISQLGLMFLACGVGAFYAAIFHLTTHAFMKALLFLSAGNVVHMMNGATNMEKMGGLSKRLPKTSALFLIGVLAMSGIPPFAAFFSKDLILEEDYKAGFQVLYQTGLVTSILTAFYLTRAYCLTFTGTPRIEERFFKGIKEAPYIMLIPVTILGLLAIGGGFLGFALGKPPVLETFLVESDVTSVDHQLSHGFVLTAQTWIAMFASLLGFGLAAFAYVRYFNRIGTAPEFLRKAFFVDSIYHALFVVPFNFVSRLVAEIFEPKVFTGLVEAAGGGSRKIATELRQLQSGQVRSYVAWMALGMVFLIVYLIF